MDIGNNCKIPVIEKTIKLLEVPMFIFSIIALFGVFWLTAGLSYPLVFLYGGSVGFVCAKFDRDLVIRLVTIILIAWCLYLGLLEKLALIGGKNCSPDDAYYYREER